MTVTDTARKYRVTFDEGWPHCQFVSCDQCGQQWSPNIKTGGGLHRGWWKCPRGCN